MRLAPLILAGAGLIAAGCATPPAGPPPLTPSAAITPNFLVPGVRDRMVFLARQEWALFGQGVVVGDAGGTARIEFPAAATHETQPAMLSRVLMYWYAVTRSPIVGDQGELQPWSAAFVAWLARGAGVTPGNSRPPSFTGTTSSPFSGPATAPASSRATRAPTRPGSAISCASPGPRRSPTSRRCAAGSITATSW